MTDSSEPGRVAIACGGTGGHLFPGTAVAEILRNAGCAVSLFVSRKEIDKHSLQSIRDMDIFDLPAVPLLAGNFPKFAASAWRSLQESRRAFRKSPPSAVLAMGGFTSLGPILAGRMAGARTFLHEANSIPGRANRWLAAFAHGMFVAFPGAASMLGDAERVEVVGMPVRPGFTPAEPGPCRMALGLAPEAPVLLVMGGSQGAQAVNDAVIAALPAFAKAAPNLQFLHLTGHATFERAREAYQAFPGRSVVLPFLTEMDLAMGAATASVSRAGASSIAEIAAMRLPTLFVPYPHAADNHQYFNARALAQDGAARLLPQERMTPEALVAGVADLVSDEWTRGRMADALGRWHRPDAAELIATRILASMGRVIEPGFSRAYSMEQPLPE